MKKKDEEKEKKKRREEKRERRKRERERENKGGKKEQFSLYTAFNPIGRMGPSIVHDKQ